MSEERPGPDEGRLPPPPLPKEGGETAPRPPRVVLAGELFAGGKEVWIEHAGERYRLRITRRNRLILQK
ncbi:MAG TPA: hemin uptake protein HemP [Gemmataceae bacterium]